MPGETIPNRRHVAFAAHARTSRPTALPLLAALVLATGLSTVATVAHPGLTAPLAMTLAGAAR